MFCIIRAESYIKKFIPVIAARYNYNSESNINPAYEDISTKNTKLGVGDMRIFVLREDFILATGIKNAYQNLLGYDGLKRAFPKSLHQFINWDDRFGHPSLTLSENNCVGTYYAGYLKKETNQISVLLASGRYLRTDLAPKSVFVLESYIAHKLRAAYGNLNVIFYHGVKDYTSYPSEKAYYDHLGLFFSGSGGLKDEPKRLYPAKIDMIQG